MRAHLYRWLLPMGLATATLLGSVELASAQPTVRDHRAPRDRVQPADVGPREAPPPIREERVRPRGRGWVWVQGHWDWKGGRWEWTSGRWEKMRRGSRWRPVTWELRNGVYVRVDGSWIDDRPTQAPPPPRDERFDNRRGFTWVPGHWDWENGQYVWVEGKYERERRGKRWRRADWQLKDGVWVRVDGTWEDDVGGPVGGGQYPTEAPPPLRDERPGTKPGFVWVRGHYDWRNGRYEWVDGHWERERARERWIDGRWELRNGRWEWIAGSWGTGAPVSQYPTTAPPAPRDEQPGAKAGFVWVRGHYEWRNGNYEWVAGHWERERADERWNEGRWDRRNDRYEWVPGGWERREPAVDTRGWFTIKEHLFDPQNEYREFDYSQKQGRVNRIMLQVLDADADIRDVTVVYTDGEKMIPNVRRSFRNGSGTQAIALDPNRILRKVTMFVKTSGKPRVLLWGQYVGGTAPPPTGGTPPPPPPTGGTPPPPPPSGPTQPPPAPREESPGTKGGFVWIRGHYEWRGNKYEWVAGHWERERARQRWIDGRWELRGGVYVWSPGYWQ